MFKVYIDPGHQGSTYNKSTTGLNYYESAMTWKLAGYLKNELQKRNIAVTFSRQSISENPSLYNRGYGAKGCDLFLSLHSNACSTESVDYPIVYRGYDKTEANDFAQKLSDKIREVMGTRNAGRVGTRKGTNGEYYGVLRGARAAGLTYYYIVEHSFHTNTEATRWLMSDANLQKLAIAESELIASYFGIANSVKPTTSTTRSYLMKGDKGTEVKELQIDLNYLGYNCGTADGDFGAKTDTALRNFQKDYKLTVDGKYGATSKAKLQEAVAKKEAASKKTTTTSSTVTGNFDLIFNATYYANTYPDLKAAFGTNATALRKHFEDYGMKEGRQGISTFNVKVYKASNADLQKAFGDDYVKYFQHYLTYGHKENRKVV